MGKDIKKKLTFFSSQSTNRTTRQRKPSLHNSPPHTHTLGIYMSSKEFTDDYSRLFFLRKPKVIRCSTIENIAVMDAVCVAYWMLFFFMS